MNRVADPELASTTLTWARARLRLGQANVGFWVLVAVAVLAVRPALGGGSLAGDVGAWVGVVGLGALLQAPFDVLGGYVLPVRYGRRAPGVGAWLGGWLRGVLVHGAVLVLVGTAAMAAAVAGGPIAAVAAVFGATLALTRLRRALFGVVTGASVRPASASLREAAARAGLDPDRVRVAAVADRGFRGGWDGDVLVLPEAWAGIAEVRDVQLVRRRIAKQAVTRGTRAAVAWHAVGWALAVAAGADLATAGGLLVAGAVVTLWSFAGLLTLPTWSRRAVHAVDALAAQALGADVVARVVRRLDRDQEDEDARPAWVGRVFHPVPTPSERVAALSEPHGTPGAYRVTRQMLWLGWGALSWLPRAVHCNVGRPDVWVWLPGE